MRKAAPQPVHAHHDQPVAGPDPLQQAGQHRTGTVAARGVLLVDLGAACRPQGLGLGQGG